MDRSRRARRHSVVAAALAAALSFPMAPVAAQAIAAARTIRYPAISPSMVIDLSNPALTLRQADCELNRVNAVVVQGNGGLVVSNAGNVQFCFFDSSGRFLKAAGRRGRGPGEFTEMYWPSRYRGDSIAVSDRMQKRVTVFGPSGERGREFVVTKPDSLGSQTLTVPLASGEWLLGFSEVTTASPRREAVTFHQQLVRVPATGGGGTRVARLAASEHFVQAVAPEMGGVAYWSLQFGRSLSVSPTPAGFVAGDGTDEVIREFDASGRVIVEHASGLKRRPVTSADIRGHRDASLKNARPDRRASVEKMLNEMPYPKATPAHGSVIADAEGPIWVQTYPDSSGSYWVRLIPATASAKGFRFPRRFRLFSVLGERACGVGLDADDLETVYCFAVPR